MKEGVSAMLLGASLTRHFYGYAAEELVRRRNYLPQRSIGGKTANEMLTGDAASLAQVDLPPFGTRCTVYNGDKDAYGYKGKECVYLGQDDENVHGSLVYVTSTNVVGVATHVSFDAKKSMNEYVAITIVDNDITHYGTNDHIEYKHAWAAQGIPARKPMIQGVKPLKAPTERSAEQLSSDENTDSCQNDASGEVCSKITSIKNSEAKGVPETQDITDIDDKEEIMPGKSRGQEPVPESCEKAEEKPALRRSGRHSRAPVKYKDYQAKSSQEKINEVVPHTAPKNFKEAKAGQHWNQWKQAMEKNIAEYVGMECLVPVRTSDIPNGAVKIGTTWAYAIKYNGDGTVNKLKARIAAQGFTMREGIDYDESYAPVCGKETLRFALAYGATHDLEILHGDTTAAFQTLTNQKWFYCTGDGEALPTKDKHGNNIVYWLKGILQGQKDAANVFYRHVKNSLTNIGFENSVKDPCLYWKGSGTDRMYVYLAICR